MAEEQRAATYQPQEVEEKWYKIWEENGYFSSEIGPSTLFAAYKTIKHMEKQGKERGEICETLKEKFGEKNPDVKVQ